MVYRLTGEGIQDASVLVVKTHEPLPPPNGIVPLDSKSKYEKVILLVRDPFEAIHAEFNRRLTNNHTEHAPIDVYKTRWKGFAYDEAVKWEHLNTYWFMSFPDPSTRHLIFYDDLVRDTQHQLEKTIEFLNIGITRNQMKCAANPITVPLLLSLSDSESLPESSSFKFASMPANHTP